MKLTIIYIKQNNTHIIALALKVKGSFTYPYYLHKKHFIVLNMRHGNHDTR